MKKEIEKEFNVTIWFYTKCHLNIFNIEYQNPIKGTSKKLVQMKYKDKTIKLINSKGKFINTNNSRILKNQIVGFTVDVKEIENIIKKKVLKKKVSKKKVLKKKVLKKKVSKKKNFSLLFWRKKHDM